MLIVIIKTNANIFIVPRLDSIDLDLDKHCMPVILHQVILALFKLHLDIAQCKFVIVRLYYFICKVF